MYFPTPKERVYVKWKIFSKHNCTRYPGSACTRNFEKLLSEKRINYKEFE